MDNYDFLDDEISKYLIDNAKREYGKDWVEKHQSTMFKNKEKLYKYLEDNNIILDNNTFDYLFDKYTDNQIDLITEGIGINDIRSNEEMKYIVNEILSLTSE